MPASLVASFLIFLITGIITLFSHSLPFTSSPFIKFIVFVIILANGCFYFYYEAYSETKTSIKNSLRQTGSIEWFFRILSQGELYFLWSWLAINWDAFHLALIILYLTYFVWDRITWDVLPNKMLVWLDLSGLLLSIMFFILVKVMEKSANQNVLESGFYMGLIMAFFLVLTGIGIYSCKFNPFTNIIRSRS